MARKSAHAGVATTGQTSDIPGLPSELLARVGRLLLDREDAGRERDFVAWLLAAGPQTYVLLLTPQEVWQLRIRAQAERMRAHAVEATAKRTTTARSFIASSHTPILDLFNSEKYAIANVLMAFDGKPICLSMRSESSVRLPMLDRLLDVFPTRLVLPNRLLDVHRTMITTRQYESSTRLIVALLKLIKEPSRASFPARFNFDAKWGFVLDEIAFRRVRMQSATDLASLQHLHVIASMGRLLMHAFLLHVDVRCARNRLLEAMRPIADRATAPDSVASLLLTDHEARALSRDAPKSLFDAPLSKEGAAVAERRLEFTNRVTAANGVLKALATVCERLSSMAVPAAVTDASPVARGGTETVSEDEDYEVEIYNVSDKLVRKTCIDGGADHGSIHDYEDDVLIRTTYVDGHPDYGRIRNFFDFDHTTLEHRSYSEHHPRHGEIEHWILDRVRLVRLTYSEDHSRHGEIHHFEGGTHMRTTYAEGSLLHGVIHHFEGGTHVRTTYAEGHSRHGEIEHVEGGWHVRTTYAEGLLHGVIHHFERGARVRTTFAEGHPRHGEIAHFKGGTLVRTTYAEAHKLYRM